MAESTHLNSPAAATLCCKGIHFTTKALFGDVDDYITVDH